MALKATIFKAELQIADMDRHYYETHMLTIAQHPSETDERMMVRLLAFAVYAHERLAFTKGISTEDEPDLWQKSLSDEIELWIELGQPDEKRLRKAAGRAQQVVIITYNSRSAAVWRSQMQDALSKLDNVTVRALNNETVEALGKLAQRNMSLQCTIQDGEIGIGDDSQHLTVRFE
ncbi:YaeQ family protein [Permianibacter sp. IMCC34836]|uniref:YaeQ family protein n=1 Tax=Permianibacter fluminis TaxID=2738515 RepID=UPI001551948D|nr:YaeQ family protein [Permianibacter fluminis]NQD38102.1 YaeQ family protein [Permianibacter fluminis]